MPSKLTHDAFVLRVHAQFSERVEVRSRYEGRLRHIALLCRACGHSWRPLAGNLLNGCSTCSRCAHGRKTPPFDLVREQITRACGDRIEIVGPYIAVAKPLPVRCTACDHTWPARVTDLRHGHGCPRCAGKLLDHAEAQRRIEAHGKLRVVGRFTTTAERIPVVCLGCDTAWEPIANNALRGHGCPTCNRQGFDPTKPSVLYCFRFTHAGGATLYKLGITNRTPLRRYEAPERKRLTLLWSLPYPTGAQAREAERGIIESNAARRYHGDTGFSFTDAEVFTAEPARAAL